MDVIFFGCNFSFDSKLMSDYVNHTQRTGRELRKLESFLKQNITSNQDCLILIMILAIYADLQRVFS